MRMRMMLSCVSLLAVLASTPAIAARAFDFDIPAGPLERSLQAFAARAGASVGTDGPIPAVRARALKGRMAPGEALDRLLAGTPIEAVQVGPNAWRLRRRTVADVPSAAASRRSEQPDRPEAMPAEIVVTASKQGVPFASYPGSIVKLDLDGDGAGGGNADASAVLVARAPSLNSTNLGPGRNKLFVRGVADSSFTGPTPATVAQYYGETRLNYAAPDPNLNLYDVSGVEILEGPQGTLYGSAAIGGIVRLVPRAPVLDQAFGSAETGVLATEKGGAGGDVAGMFNLPVGPDAAVRAVGYGVLNPGFIDDVGRGLTDVNRTVTYGARVTARYEPAKDVSLEAGGIYQDLESRDGQYAELGLPPLSRRSAIAQPFDNDFRLAFVTVRSPLLGASLVSSTGFVRQELRTQFDATPAGGAPAAFVEDLGLSVLSHETRLTGGSPAGAHWLLGVSGLISTTTARRQLGPLGTLVQIAGVRNVEREVSAFGEATLPLFARVDATVGGRLNYDEASGELLNVHLPEKAEPKRRNWRVLPKVALSWAPADHWLIFVHYQEGFRPGGLSVTGPTTAEKFKSDTVWALEGGFRAGVPERDRLTGSLTLSRTRWYRIQADLIDMSGLPFTSNVGNGYIDSIEAAGTWRASADLSIDAALFLNRADLNRRSAQADMAGDANFPNIPETGASAALRYRHTLRDGLAVTGRAEVRYVGRSFLGIEPPLDLKQGRYALANAQARIGGDRYGLRLSIDNLLDVRANRFSYGNPFTVSEGRQVTPLRPRTIRIGADVRF